MSITKKAFGTAPDGKTVYEYTLVDEKGQSVCMLDYGCVIRTTEVLDKSGGLVDVSMGYDSLEEYVACTASLGAIIGRVANRIGGAAFTLDGKRFELFDNNHGNCLHGGKQGFNKKRFDSEIIENSVVFTYVSPDGEEGFPGTLTLKNTVIFKNGALRLQFDYESDRDTVAAFTNHNYFNLNGHDSGSVLAHTLFIDADGWCKADETLLAQSPVVPVEGTPFDFRSEKPIGRDMSNENEQIRLAKGYDHNFALNARSCDAPAAVATGEISGVTMSVFTDMPGLQFYTANNLSKENGEPIKGKGGAKYSSYDALCLEAQEFPNAINEPRFPSNILLADTPKSAYIEFRFSAKQ